MLSFGAAVVFGQPRVSAVLLLLFFLLPGSAIQGWAVGAVFLLLCGSVSSGYAALRVI